MKNRWAGAALLLLMVPLLAGAFGFEGDDQESGEPSFESSFSDKFTRKPAGLQHINKPRISSTASVAPISNSRPVSSPVVKPQASTQMKVYTPWDADIEKLKHRDKDDANFLWKEDGFKGLAKFFKHLNWKIFDTIWFKILFLIAVISLMRFWFERRS